MIDKQMIFAKQEEYTEYLYRSNKDNKIRRFFGRLISDLPINLKQEIKQLPTTLITSTENLAITGGEAFVFDSKGSSPSLSDFLKKYLVIVERDSEEVLAWKSNLRFLIRGYADKK